MSAHPFICECGHKLSHHNQYADSCAGRFCNCKEFRGALSDVKPWEPEDLLGNTRIRRFLGGAPEFDDGMFLQKRMNEIKEERSVDAAVDTTVRIESTGLGVRAMQASRRAHDADQLRAEAEWLRLAKSLAGTTERNS